MGDVLRFAALTSVSSHLLVMRGRFEHGRPITDRRTGSKDDLCDSLARMREPGGGDQAPGGRLLLVRRDSPRGAFPDARIRWESGSGVR